MCLILLAKNVHPKWNLVVAANRDEFYQRPTINANYWSNHPHILAGQDLTAGGTWLGVDRKGRFAALTNIRQTPLTSGSHSRGELIPQFLSDHQSAIDFEHKIDYYKYAGFNLLVDDGKDSMCFSNRFSPVTIDDGIHGLSNASMNTPWPKVIYGRQRLEACLQLDDFIDNLFELLRHDRLDTDIELPETGIGFEKEKMLAPLFIKSPEYGTRTSTVVLRSSEKLHFIERNFDRGNTAYQESRYEINLR